MLELSMTKQDYKGSILHSPHHKVIKTSSRYKRIYVILKMSLLAVWDIKEKIRYN